MAPAQRRQSRYARIRDPAALPWRPKRARAGAAHLRPCVHSTAGHDLQAASLKDRHRISVRRRQEIDRLLSRLAGWRPERYPIRLVQTLKILKWIRARLDRTDELIRHPERIRDPGELAALLRDAMVLAKLAEQAMHVAHRSDARRRPAARTPEPRLSWQ
jgi:hypothetical protein